MFEQIHQQHASFFLTKPNSTTGHFLIIYLASDVPPVVEKFADIPVYFLTDFLTNLAK